MQAEGPGVFIEVPLDEWVAGAKRAETRRRRVERALAMLREGRRSP